ncbi:hypothetical protein BKA67DRAFT_536458 [Truncatella angustata]|uniref:AMP-dependent synthetase/ligase domain-containing protein n=1 Tax=Truncatella angustata TaxID=152316 RepID=A0A9P8UID2_9PEZI|nr:uncharacterized protein BKA67DRAFT_536458 [Truncatella angustata]KAH6652736.1 hypothetical protein BKA67DRAFT_536458 [Truncatella angustata]KAH8204649.1 hypothetical protein TruAng_001124 [Truncatella angustata]
MLATPNPSLSGAVLNELIRYVQRNSQYYRDLYRDIPGDASSLEQLPVIEHARFWLSNTCNPETNRLLTSTVIDGGIFRSGGTTGDPKVSFYSRNELNGITRDLADCLKRAGLQPGDRVANLLSNGDLYMGYLLNVLSWADSSIPFVQLPISTLVEVERMVWPLQEFQATVLSAMPTILIRISDYLSARGEQLPSVHLIVYGGENLHQDSKAVLKKTFPNAAMRPMMYGSVDGGLIGLPTHDTTLEHQVGGPIYTPNSPSVVVEILNEDGVPVTAIGQTGPIYVTNLTRRLMPVIRYPTGDVAEWVDYSQRLFTLRGRDVIGFKIGPASYDFRHLRNIVVKVLGDGNISAFQVAARRSDRKDELVFRIASHLSDHDEWDKKLEGALRADTFQYVSNLETGIINPLVVEWVDIEAMHTNQRTGKLRDVVDERVS